MIDPIFPADYSSLRSDALVERVLVNYHVTPPITCQLLHRGANDLYLVTTGNDSFVLCVYTFNALTQEEWEAQAQIVATLDR